MTALNATNVISKVRPWAFRNTISQKDPFLPNIRAQSITKEISGVTIPRFAYVRFSASYTLAFGSTITGHRQGVILLSRFVLPIGIQKRNMMLSTPIRNLIYRGGINRAAPLSQITDHDKRDLATLASWSAQRRVQPPLKKDLGEVAPNFKVYDKLTGYEIMQPKDPSGVTHMFLVDKTYYSDNYFLVLGTFTSSSKVIDGITPEKISDTQFHGKEKPQYFLRYPKPKLICREHAKLAKMDIFESNTGNMPAEYKNFLGTVTPINQDLY